MAECYLPIYNEEPCNSTIGYDIVKHRDEYMRLFTEKIYRQNSPQIAAWNHQTQKVGRYPTERISSSEFINSHIVQMANSLNVNSTYYYIFTNLSMVAYVIEI